MAGKARLIPKKFLSADEQLVFESRPSAWLHMKGAALGVILFFACVVLYFWKDIPNTPAIPYLSDAMANADYGNYVHWAIAAIAGLFLLLVMTKYLRWSSTVYAATNERIITQKGILSKTYDDIPLNMITNIDLAQSLGNRALGYGTMVFSTQGLGGRKADEVWKAVPNPMAVRRKLQEAMDSRARQKQ